MAKQNLYNKNNRVKGQATTELAVMGTIMLLIFGALLRYGQMFNAQQEAQMYAFRKSLELAQKRYNAGRFGQVSLTTMREYYPVELSRDEPQVTYASASTSVTVDNNQAMYEREDPDKTEVGVTYYQVGNKMIENNELIEVPYIKVERKIDSHKAPKSSYDAMVSWMNDDDDDYDTLEPVGFTETILNVEGASSSHKEVKKTSAPNTSKTTEQSSHTIDETTEYITMTEEQMRESDSLVKKVGVIPPNMIIEKQQTLERQRSYSAND